MSQTIAKIDLTHIKEEIRQEYEKYRILESLEEDLERWNVRLDECMVAFIDILFGSTLRGGVPELVIDHNNQVFVDGELHFEKPSAVELFTILIVFAVENGDPSTYLTKKIKD